MTHPSELDAEIQKTEARLAELQAQREAISAEPDYEAWRPALQAYYFEINGSTIVNSPFDQEDKAHLKAIRAAFALAPRPEVDEGWVDDVAKRLTERFLAWKLPEDFNPDGGVSFQPLSMGLSTPIKNQPTGTNLFNYTQAKAMFEYLLDDPAIRETLTRAPGVSWPGVDELRESLGPKFKHLAPLIAAEMIPALVEGLHAQVFAVHSAGDPLASHRALGDGGQIHETVHALVRAMPTREHMTGAAS